MSCYPCKSRCQVAGTGPTSLPHHTHLRQVHATHSSVHIVLDSLVVLTCCMHWLPSAGILCCLHCGDHIYVCLQPLPCSCQLKLTRHAGACIKQQVWVALSWLDSQLAGGLLADVNATRHCNQLQLRACEEQLMSVQSSALQDQRVFLLLHAAVKVVWGDSHSSLRSTHSQSPTCNKGRRGRVKHMSMQCGALVVEPFDSTCNFIINITLKTV